MLGAMCLTAAMGLHLGTYHFDRTPRYNEFNYGIYKTCNDFVVGTYRNSQYRQSFYAGYTFRTVYHIDLTLGAVTGYNAAPVVPMVVPSVRFGNVRLSLIPPIGNIVDGGVHLSLEFDL